jgi:hypothetical protein
MNSHANNKDASLGTQNLRIDLDGELSEEMEQFAMLSLWKMIAPGDLDGPLIAFYIFLLLFLLALARAICC